MATAVIGFADIWGKDIEYSTGDGEEKVLTLPSGVEVTLNESSKISFAKGTPRKINFWGRALFDVTAEKLPQSLQVHTAYMSISTKRAASFKMLSEPEYTSVEVLSGAISVTTKGDPSQILQMEKGETFTFPQHL